MYSTKKDIAKSIKTLIVALQSMRGQQVAITLRNDTIVLGKVIKVDANMNIELSDVTVEQDPFYLTSCDEQNSPESIDPMAYFLVKGTRIRHIDVPGNFDIISETRQEIERIKGRTKAWKKSDVV